MTAITVHELVPTTDPEIAARRVQCATADHPHSCFNPWLDETFCRCGAQRVAGDQMPPLPEIPLCSAFTPMTLQSYCGACFHDRDEHAEPADLSVEAQFALFPAA